MKKYLFISLMLFVAIRAKSQNQNPCDKIEFDNDEVRGFKSYSTPIDINGSHMFYINKIIETNKKPVYYLHIRVNEPLGKTVNGVYILLNNGSKISRPDEEINLEADPEDNDGIIHLGFKQSVVIELTPIELKNLKSSPIKKYAISYLDEDMPNANEFYQIFLCLLNK